MMWLLWLACTSVSTETAVSSFDEADPWRGYDHTQEGPYQVGHMLLEHTYVPISDQAPRTIFIDVWYPSQDTSGEAAGYLYGIDEQAFAHATPAESIYEGGYPVHVHSHGYRAWGASSSFLMRYFASHGWIAVAPNHTNNLLGDHQSPLPVSHFIHRPKDIQESLDVLSTLSFPDPVNSQRVLMSGHSFGASYSTWSVSGASYDNVEAICLEGAGLEDSSMRCSEAEAEILRSRVLLDDRVVAAVPLAGTVRESWFGSEGYKSVHAPVLFVSGTEDGQSGNQAHFDTVEGIDFQWLSIAGGCHQSFATGACDTLAPDIGFSIQQSYILAFARQRVLSDNGPEITALLNGEERPFADAYIQIKER